MMKYSVRYAGMDACAGIQSTDLSKQDKGVIHNQSQEPEQQINEQ